MMPDNKKQPFDLSEEASRRDSEQGTAAARQAESDDISEGSALGNTPTPEGDNYGENKVATSLSDD
jgi:hypothetical protein